MRFFFRNQIIVSRLKTTNGNFKEYQSTGTAEAHIQRNQESRDEQQSGVFAKQFHIWAPIGTDIKPGDRIRDENGVEYDVTNTYESYFGCTQFIEILVELTEGYSD
jgi:hypothetical protein|tara:strand:- start:1279 stop:1596 length:318 start_codon:yes stop_codon:yes gene_type:complete